MKRVIRNAWQPGNRPLTFVQLVRLVDVQRGGSADEVQTRLRDIRRLGRYLGATIELDCGHGDGQPCHISWGETMVVQKHLIESAPRLTTCWRLLSGLCGDRGQWLAIHWKGMMCAVNGLPTRTCYIDE